MPIHKDDELSDSELLDMLEEDIESEGAFMAGYREKRLEEMKRECVGSTSSRPSSIYPAMASWTYWCAIPRLEKTRDKQQDGMGQLIELKVEKDVIQATL